MVAHGREGGREGGTTEVRAEDNQHEKHALNGIPTATTDNQILWSSGSQGWGWVVHSSVTFRLNFVSYHF